MTPRLLPSALLISILLISPTRADVGFPQPDWDIANATTILLVHAPTEAEIKTLPAELKTTLIVDSLLKGSDTRQYIPDLNPGLPPGSSALILLRFREASFSPITTQKQPPPEHAPTDLLLPITRKGNDLFVNLPPSGQKEFINDAPVPLESFKKLITPEELTLHAHTLDALFFPDRFADLQKRDPAGAAYAQLNLAMRDLYRDVPALARLLESPDAGLRVAVAAHLKKITSAKVTEPTSADPAGLHEYALAWSSWWAANCAAVIWQESSLTYVPLPKDAAASGIRWPKIPGSMDLPAETLTENLLKTFPAKGLPDIAAFAPAFRALLDAGAQRDRILLAASQVQWTFPENAPPPTRPEWCTAILNAPEFRSIFFFMKEPRYTPEAILIDSQFPPCMFNGSGPYLPPAPRISQDIIFNSDIPAAMRLRAILNFTRYLQNDRFLMERQAALQTIAATQDHDLIRRAAFWEPYLDYPPVPTIAQAAFDLLAKSSDPADQKFLLDLLPHRLTEPLAITNATNLLQKSGTPEDQKRLAAAFLAEPHAASGAAWFAAKARQKDFINAVLLDLATSKGERFNWPGRILAEAGVEGANAVLASRLADADPDVRKAAIQNLSWHPTAEILKPLLQAFVAEKNPEISQLQLDALTKSTDPHAREFLISAAGESRDPDALAHIALALGRVHNTEALPALADLVTRYRDDKAHPEVLENAVISFGTISGIYTISLPDQNAQPQNIDPKLIQDALPKIDDWIKDHPKP